MIHLSLGKTFSNSPKKRITARLAASLAVGLGLGGTAIVAACGSDDETFRLPYSSLLTAEVVQRLQQQSQPQKAGESVSSSCGQSDGSKDPIKNDQIRSCEARFFYDSPQYRSIRKQYEVSLSTQTMGGVPVEIFVPMNGVSSLNKHRVLINLHGGAFRVGSRTISHLESIPISAVARIKVISVDYRMAPQFYFPAASEDVAAVYAQVLKEYEPSNIGIYGCSAGGLLTAQSMAWLQKENFPMPGAIGMFCGAATYWSEGDSGNMARMWDSLAKPITEDPNFEYLKKEDLGNPLAYPARSKDIMAHFPPSLLITSTRDPALSSVAYTHSMLIQQGVPAELYVWEGLPHAFMLDPGLPQSREVYEVARRFFERNLGNNPHKDKIGSRSPLSETTAPALRH